MPPTSKNSSPNLESQEGNANEIEQDAAHAERSRPTSHARKSGVGGGSYAARFVPTNLRQTGHRRRHAPAVERDADFGIADIGTGIERLVDRSGKPEEIWLDNYCEHRFDKALRFWAERQGISIIYVPMQMPRMKSISERLLGNMSAFLRDKRFPTLMELGHEIERWRQSYTPAARTIPEVNQ
ncbi:hypothetical protein [Bradyrhizobium zhanjiangense]|uniref:hypothetical protein n=1 Tax=Bradyrhizobium zhanjiangense TaxID=1325107 RepID=UPI001008C121|nr:hypothetical protein [Bradyrhizobium zhanjiangense]